jgi:phosphatidylserine/phosphatidylglycerophosphate/cardiolipin synthase-like enzyme
VESVPKETKLEESKLPRTLDVWLNMINNAGRSIDFEMFYFSNNKNSSLVSIFDAIKSAAGRGVQIRIIVDSSFYAKNDHSSDELEGIQNITIRKIPYVNLGGGIMHAKYFIVDEETLFMGSQNMDWRAVEHIHEIGVMVKNKSFVSTFQKIFDLDWNYCVSKGDTPLESLNKSKKKIVNSKNHILINSDYYGKVNIYPAFSPYDYTPKKFSKEEKEIVKLIGNTKTKLCIQIYSFSDKIYKEEKKFDSFYKALKKAAKRGVDIKIIMPDWATGKNSINFIKDLSKIKNIQIKISSIPEYSQGFIPFARVEHCKYFISDNKISFISTSNWEYEYFYKSRNASVIIKNKTVNSDLTDVFMRDWDGPYTQFVDVNKDYKPPKRN